VHPVGSYCKDISLICDKSVTTQNLAFLNYWYRKETFADALVSGIVSQRSLQNSPLGSSCVVFALIEKYRTSKLSNVSREKSLILSRDTVVANELHHASRWTKHYIYIYIYIYIHTHTHSNARARAHTHKHAHTHTHNTHIHKHTHTHTLLANIST
jgi:hypothetical protein